MTANGMDFTPAERAALDRVTVPAMRDGFAADLVATAVSGLRVPPRRGARGGWRAHGKVLIGAGALLLASATAAATGWFGKLPIAIPGITRIAAAPPVGKPKHVVRTARPKPAIPAVESLAALPEALPTLAPPPAPGLWRAQRQARIAAGLPARRPLVRRALLAKFRTMPSAQRQAAVVEWRRIKALPPPERKAAIARLKADFLATHPRVAARVEQRLEARSALAASGGDPPKLGMTTRLEGGAMPPGFALAGPLTPQERFERRQLWRERHARRRATQSQSDQPLPGEGRGGPIR